MLVAVAVVAVKVVVEMDTNVVAVEVMDDVSPKLH